MPLYWLELPDGCAIIPASDRIGAMWKAGVTGLYPGGLVPATPLDDASQRLVTEDMIGRVLRDKECRAILRRLEAAAVPKRPARPSIRREARSGAPHNRGQSSGTRDPPAAYRRVRVVRSTIRVRRLGQPRPTAPRSVGRGALRFRGPRQ